MNEAQLQAALALLPHGAEFRFVDRLLELDPGKSGVGEYRVRGDETFLRGHFPGEPLMPGVLLVEAVAQLAGVVAQSNPAIAPLPGLKLAALRNVKILGSAPPGATLQMEARITGRLGNLIQAQGQVLAGAKVLLRGELSLAGSTG